jgi:hypothetical protein
MTMITELQLQQQIVLGGEKIAVFKWQVANTHLQQTAAVISRLQLAMIESDSNNTSGQMIPSDAESFYEEWNRAKTEWARGLKWSHLSPAPQEKILSILAVTDNEQLRTPNVKCRRVVMALATLIHKIVYCDSSKLQFGIGQGDVKKISEHMAYVEEVLLDYVGTGAGKDGAFDVGRYVPAFEHLGVVVPPINLHEAQVQEPSPAAPNVPAPDAPDTASTVPAPGTNSQAAS